MTRAPPLFPDVVTLRPGPLPEDLLAAIEESPGCCVKDSFATLDRGPHGFHVLLDAQWIASPLIDPELDAIALNDDGLDDTGTSDPHWTGRGRHRLALVELSGCCPIVESHLDRRRLPVGPSTVDGPAGRFRTAGATSRMGSTIDGPESRVRLVSR